MISLKIRKHRLGLCLGRSVPKAKERRSRTESPHDFAGNLTRAGQVRRHLDVEKELLVAHQIGRGMRGVESFRHARELLAIELAELLAERAPFDQLAEFRMMLGEMLPDSPQRFRRRHVPAAAD